MGYPGDEMTEFDNREDKRGKHQKQKVNIG
jgi:hypothetical protein